MSASKQPTERRLSPTKLLNLSYPRNKWLSALREEIINSNVKAWDFRIAIFFISLLIYLPIFSALTSWLPTIITGNTFFLLFGLTLSYILAGKTFVVLKQQAEADKEREKNVLAEQTQGDQHGGAPKRDRANFLLFSKKSGEPYPLWLRNLYSYFFSLKEKQTHYTLTFMFMLIITIIIGYIDLGIGKVFIFLPIFINYTIGLAFTVTINMVCIILLTISIHLLREDAGREEAIMLELNRREQEEKLRQRFAETSKQSFEIQDESPNELLASEYETLSQYDHRYQRPDWIRMPRNLMASFTSKSEFSLFMILTIFFFFILYLMKAPELINPQIIFYKIFHLK